MGRGTRRAPPPPRAGAASTRHRLFPFPAAPPDGSRSAGGAQLGRAHKERGIVCRGWASPAPPRLPRPPRSDCHVTPPPAGTPPRRRRGGRRRAAPLPVPSRRRGGGGGCGAQPPLPGGEWSREPGPGGNRGLRLPGPRGRSPRGRARRREGEPRGGPPPRLLRPCGGAAGSSPRAQRGREGRGPRGPARAWAGGQVRRERPTLAQGQPQPPADQPPPAHRDPSPPSSTESPRRGRGEKRDEALPPPLPGVGAPVPPHLEHEPQQEDHGHAGHDVRMVLHDELVAQHRRILVALLADGHGGQGVGRRRRRLPRCQHSSSRRGQEEAEGEEAAAQPRNGSRRFASPRPGRREQPRPPPAAPLPAGGPPPHPPAGAARGSARQFKPTNGGGPAASPPPGGRPGWRCGPGPVSRAEPSRAAVGGAGRVLAGCSPEPALGTGSASLCRSADRRRPWVPPRSRRRRPRSGASGARALPGSGRSERAGPAAVCARRPGPGFAPARHPPPSRCSLDVLLPPPPPPGFVVARPRPTGRWAPAGRSEEAALPGLGAVTAEAQPQGTACPVLAAGPCHPVCLHYTL